MQGKKNQATPLRFVVGGMVVSVPVSFRRHALDPSVPLSMASSFAASAAPAAPASGRMVTVSHGGSVPSYFTIFSSNPTFDNQYGHLLTSALRDVAGVSMAAVVISHVVGTVTIEVDAPGFSLEDMRAAVRACLLLRAQQVHDLAASLADCPAALDDERVFTVEPREV